MRGTTRARPAGLKALGLLAAASLWAASPAAFAQASDSNRAAESPVAASSQPPAVSPSALTHGYADAEEAFLDVFIRSGLALRGYEENREYAAAIYQMPDGRWYATAVVAGGVKASSIPYDQVPHDAVRVDGAHTHGQPRIPGDSLHLYGGNFSDTDRRAAIRNFKVTRGRIAEQLLLTSRLEMLRMAVSRGYDAASGEIAIRARVSLFGSVPASSATAPRPAPPAYRLVSPEAARD